MIEILNKQETPMKNRDTPIWSWDNNKQYKVESCYRLINSRRIKNELITTLSRIKDNQDYSVPIASITKMLY